MWVSPRHPNPPRQPAPPPDDGQELATIKRSDGHELRVRLKTYQSHPYVLIQLWHLDTSGAAWPVKGRSVSIRMAEVAAVIDGLQGAAAAAGEMSRRQDRTGQGDAPVTGFSGGSRGETAYERSAPQGSHLKEDPPPRDDGPKFVDRGRPVRPPFDPASMPKLQGGEGFSEFTE